MNVTKDNVNSINTNDEQVHMESLFEGLVHDDVKYTTVDNKYVKEILRITKGVKGYIIRPGQFSFFITQAQYDAIIEDLEFPRDYDLTNLKKPAHVNIGSNNNKIRIGQQYQAII